MRSTWRWCLKIGAMIVLVDVAALALGQSQSGAGEIAEVFDLIVNAALFSYVGARVGRQTGRVTSAAEAGVITSLLPGVVAAVYQFAIGTTATETSPAVRAIQGLAFNVALGGVVGLISGWIVCRGRQAAR